MKHRRVKITGVGPVTPAGIGREAFWNGILEPVSRVRPFTGLSDEYGAFIAAYLDDFKIENYLDKSSVPKGAARQSLLAIAGTVLALQDSGISTAELRLARVVVVTGSCVVDFGGIVSSILGVRERGIKGAIPRIVYSSGVGSVPSAINTAMGINARTVALSNQCSSGINAIGYAASLVATGEVDLAICGGTDAPLHQTPLLEFRAGRIIAATVEMAKRQARPFDLWRTAGAIGEGCAMFVLEAEDSRRKGYSYISGYGFANDRDTAVCSGIEEAGRIAMSQALVRPEDVEVISAWAPGDARIDKGEALAMRDLFGANLQNIAAGSIKGSIGSPLGAAPAIQVAAAALSQKFGVLPPTVNWEYPDPDCRLNLCGKPRSLCHRVTLINAHGVGAVNGSLLLERC